MILSTMTYSSLASMGLLLGLPVLTKNAIRDSLEKSKKGLVDSLELLGSVSTETTPSNGNDSNNDRELVYNDSFSTVKEALFKTVKGIFKVKYLLISAGVYVLYKVVKGGRNAF